MVFSINLNEEEQLTFKQFAKSHNISLDEAFKLALSEKISEESDLNKFYSFLKLVKRIKT